MTADMSPVAREIVARALQFRHCQIHDPRTYVRAVQVMVGRMSRTEKVKSGGLILYGSYFIMARVATEKFNNEGVGCIVEGLAMLPDDLRGSLFKWIK
jgi:hypothetical protein